MRLPASGIPKFDGLDELRRLVQSRPRALGDDDLARMSDLVDELYPAGEDMPFGYRGGDLGHALATFERRGDAAAARESEQVRAAWGVRFDTDPNDQTRIGARIDALLDGGAPVLDTQRGVAELRTLLHLSTSDRHLPRELGLTTPSMLDEQIRWTIADPLVRDGRIGAPGREFLQLWDRARRPKELAAWRASINDAARGRGELPRDMSLEQLFTPAAGWPERSRAQRMRLLDALASIDGELAPVRTRATNPRSYRERSTADVRSHVSRQVGRAITGEAALPPGLTAREVIGSWHYRRAPFERQLAVLRTQTHTAQQGILDEYSGIRDQLDRAALQVGREQVALTLEHAARTGDPLPEWVEAGDIITAVMTERQKATILQPYLTPAWSGTPTGAAATLVNARLRIHGEQMGGGAVASQGLRASTLELIDRNLERISGTVADGYGGHPDYADVGRVESNLALLADLQASTNARAVAAASTPVAMSPPTGSTLSW